MNRRTFDNPQVAFPVLLADVGGTNARFAVLDEPGCEIRTFPTLSTRAVSSAADALAHVVSAGAGSRPRSLLMAAAMPLGRGHLALTNADWTVDPAEWIERFGFEDVILFNDFEAIAMALPFLAMDDLAAIGEAEPDPAAHRVVLGPGTGLGVAALAAAGPRFAPISGEGGHVDFGPVSAFDFRLWPHLADRSERISAESLLSGPGLARLYRGLVHLDGGATTVRTGEDVSAAAALGDALAQRSLDLFAEYLGRFAGDLALTFLARGGVYIAGGIAPRMLETLQAGRFRTAFEAKAPHAAIMRDLPTMAILHANPAFVGLAAFAEKPGRFYVSLHGRRLRA